MDWEIDWEIDWLIDWLIDELIDWLTDGWIDWLRDWWIDWLMDGLIDWFIDWWMDWLIDWLIETFCQVVVYMTSLNLVSVLRIFFHRLLITFFTPILASPTYLPYQIALPIIVILIFSGTPVATKRKWREGNNCRAKYEFSFALWLQQ